MKKYIFRTITISCLAAATLVGLASCVKVNWGEDRGESSLDVSTIDGGPADVIPFGEEGGRQELSIASSGKGWLAMRNYPDENSGGDWVEILPPVGAAGETTATVNVKRNTTSPKDRTAYFDFKCGDLVKQIKITQPAVPVAYTDSVDYVLFDGATVYGSWKYEGDQTMEPEEYGFKYRLRGSDQWISLTAGTPDENGVFSLELTGLDGNATYEFQAYVTFPAPRGEIAGEIMTFRTGTNPALTTVSQLRSDYASNAGNYIVSEDDPQKIEVVVVSDATGGNVPDGCLYVVDAASPTTAGSGILIQTDGSVTYAAGDKLEIVLTGAELGHIVGLPQVLAATNVQRITKTGTQTVEATVVAQTDLAGYESMLVTVVNTQLLQPFTNTSNFPTWASTDAMTMEVNGSDITYAVSVLPGASFASLQPASGSGSLTGIASLSGDNTAIFPRTTADIDLAGARFASLLGLKFTDVALDGTLVVGQESTAKVRIGYDNAAGETISVVTVTSTMSDLVPTPTTPYVLGTGTGYIDVPVTGTPASSGAVTFTVTAIDGYTLPSPANCNTEVIANLTYADFTATWAVPSGTNATTAGQQITAPGGARTLALASAATGLDISAISGDKDWGAPAATVTGWNNTLGGATDAANSATNASTYMQFTVDVTASGAKITGFSASIRSLNDVTVYAMYSVNGAATKVASVNSGLLASGNRPCNIDLSGETALQNLPKGTTVTMMLVPVDSGSGIFAFRSVGPTLTGQVAQ